MNTSDELHAALINERDYRDAKNEYRLGIISVDDLIVATGKYNRFLFLQEAASLISRNAALEAEVRWMSELSLWGHFAVRLPLWAGAIRSRLPKVANWVHRDVRRIKENAIESYKEWSDNPINVILFLVAILVAAGIFSLPWLNPSY